MAVGDKYIVEVQAVFHDADYPITSELYRIKGFNTLVFDHYGLNQLERLEKHDDKLITKLAKNYTAQKHGKWDDVTGLDNEFLCYACSECRHGYVFPENRPYKYCPNCGAQMNGDSNE